jgi:hypothetical protein
MRPTDDYGTDHGDLHGGLRHHEPLYTDALHNEDVAHEHSDVNVRSLLLSAAAMAAVVLFTFGAMWVMFHALEDMAAKRDPVLSPHALPAGQLPPAPRIEDNLNEPGMLRKHRAMEAETLNSYGWENQQDGVARLPIAEAKKLLLQRGLPYRADGPTDAWLGTRSTGPARGESSSGRRIPTAPGAEAETPAPAAPATTPHAPAPAPHKGGH